MDYFQIQYEILGQLFENARDNASEIVRIYFTIIGHKDFESSNLIYLNQKAVLLLSPEVVYVLKKTRLDAFSYLLVANNLLDLEDVKEDLLNGDVLAKATPSNSIRRLKSELGLATNLMDQSIAAEDINRLPIEIKNECTEFRYVEGMTLYKLKLTQVPTYTEPSSIVKRFSFGEPIFGDRKRKTILLMGATGSGKTTMINAMINYILGVEWKDPFRFILVDEELRGASQANSQTQGVTAYDIHYRNGFRIPFSLTLVDTPGFGDTGGMERDKEITPAVEKFFKDENGIKVMIINNCNNITIIIIIKKNNSKVESHFNIYQRNWTLLASSSNQETPV
jgi:GTP-binding protein EngB required for normal cell division